MGLKDYGAKLHKLREERERFLELIRSLDKRLARGEITKYQRQFTINSITHGLTEREYLRSLEIEMIQHEKAAAEERSKSPILSNLIKVSAGIIVIIILLTILIVPGILKFGNQDIRHYNLTIGKSYYANSQNFQAFNIPRESTVTSVKINGAYFGDVQVYLVANDTSAKYLIFDSRKYENNIISITGNLFIVKGDPGAGGTKLTGVCDETCKLEIDPTMTHLEVVVGKEGFIYIDNLEYDQVIVNHAPTQVKDISTIILNDTSKNIDLSTYFIDEENDKLTYTISNVPGVNIFAKGNTVTFKVEKNIMENYSGFLFVSDGRDKINSNVFKIVVDTTRIQDRISKEDDSPDIVETEENKTELPGIKTNKTIDVNSNLTTNTGVGNQSNNTINVTIDAIQKNETGIYGTENTTKEVLKIYYFNFDVDQKLIDTWIKNPSATPRILVKYADENTQFTDEYIEELRSELEIRRITNPEEFNKAELLERKAELEKQVGLLKAKSFNKNIEGNNLFTGNVVYDVDELNITQIINELNEVNKKINTIEVYDTLKDYNTLKSIKHYANSNIEVLESNSSDIKLLRFNNNIEKIYLDEPVTAMTIESTNLIKIPESRLEFEGLDGRNITICMLDTGINSEFIKNPSIGYNFINDTNDYSDDNGHGTSVGYVVYTIVPNATLIVGKVLDASGQGYESGLISGLQYCADNNASIISLSLGSGGYNGYCDSNPVAMTVNELNANGILVVSATGNDETDLVKVPACASGALAVGASAKNDSVASFTSWNNNTLLMAPGVDISTINIDGDTLSISGTSMSVPFVTGVGVMLKQHDSNLTSTSLKDRIIHTGQIIYDNDKMFSRIDAYNALIGEITNNLTPQGNSGEGTNGTIGTLIGSPCSDYTGMGQSTCEAHPCCYWGGSCMGFSGQGGCDMSYFCSGQTIYQSYCDGTYDSCGSSITTCTGSCSNYCVTGTGSCTYAPIGTYGGVTGCTNTYSCSGQNWIRNTCTGSSGTCGYTSSTCSGTCNNYCTGTGGSCTNAPTGTDCGSTCQSCSGGSCINTPSNQDYQTECAFDQANCGSDYCSGTGASCGYITTGTCRADAGSCDVAETCAGVTSRACPADSFEPAGTLCSGACRECDASGNCNADDATRCTDSWGLCGYATCTTGTCGNAAEALGTDCGSTCQSCDGGGNCTNTASNQDYQTECTYNLATCASDFCSGTGASCGYLSSGTCRADAGECDVAETCAGGPCPADSFEPLGTDCTGACKSCNSGGVCTFTDGQDYQSECAASYTCSGQTIINNDLCNGAGACGDPGTTCNGLCNYCSAGSGTCTNNASGTFCNAAWQCSNRTNTNGWYWNGYGYYTQGYCDGSGNCGRSGSDVAGDGDSSTAACECLASGTQGNCDNAESNCWMTAATVNYQCCQGTDNQCNGTTGSGNGYCNSGTYTTDADTSSGACSCMTTNGYWNVGGELSPTACCLDDGGENYNYKRAYKDSGTYDVSWSDNAGDNACCNAATDCVNNSVCYAATSSVRVTSTGTDQVVRCNSGSNEWLDVDYGSGGCTDAGFNWAISGNGSIGEYGSSTNGGNGVTECCGDDASENYRSCLNVSGFPDANSCNSGIVACCDHSNDCVTTNGSLCVAAGSTAIDADLDGNTDYCNAGTWYDCNTNSECPAGDTCTAGDCVSSSMNYTFLSPTPSDSGRNINNTVRINVSITSVMGTMETCRVEFAGVNYSMTKNGTGTIVTCNWTGTTVDGTLYSYRIYANNSFGTWGKSLIRTFTENTMATVSTVTVTPLNPNATTNLTCSVSGWSDAEGDTANYYYRWYNDTTLRYTSGPTTATTNNLSYTNLSVGDRWNCTVITWDSFENGTGTSNNVSVTGPPTITFQGLTPSHNGRSFGNSVTIEAGVTLNNGAIDSCIIDFNNTNYTMNKIGSGSSVTCQWTTSTTDGVAYSYRVYANNSFNIWGNSTLRNFTENIKPTITQVNLTPLNATIADNLTCSVYGWSDAEGDTAQYRYLWYRNKTFNREIGPTTESTNILLNSALNVSDKWFCMVFPYDGYEEGSPVQSNNMTILSGCGLIIPASTTYTLTKNISINGTSCLDITAQNVVLDCNGYSIIGNNTPNTYGIYSTNNQTTIRNCNIINFDVGIGYNGTNNGAIYNNNVTSLNGIYFTASSSGNITNNSLSVTSTVLKFSSNSGYNRVYWNNFLSGSIYINNSNGTNSFNTTSGVAQGNYYSGIGNILIYDTNSNGWGDSGSQYPLNSTNWPTKWTGDGTDWGPNTSRVNTPPNINASLSTPSGANHTSENLTLAYTAIDSDGDYAYNATDWRRNGTSIAVLNMPFNVNVSNASGAVKDLSTWNNNGTLAAPTATPTWQSNGKIGGAYYFDGGDRIDLGTFTNLNGASQFTISMWLNKSDSGTFASNRGFIGRGSSTQTVPWCLGVTGAQTLRCVFETSTGGVNDCDITSGNVPDGQWFHFALRWDGTTCQIYINGTASGTSGTTTGVLSNTDGNNYIGYIAQPTYWLGAIDEVKIYNRSLSPQQIYQEYAAGNNNKTVNTIVSNETSVGNVWSAKIQSCDQYNCTEVISNNITIIDSITISNVILNATSRYNLTTDNLTLTYNATGASSTFTDWRLSGQSIALVNMPFDEDVSSTSPDAITDYSTWSNHGTLAASTATPAWVTTGKIGGAYSFDGTNDAMNLSSGFTQLDGVNEFTISMWLNKQDSGSFASGGRSVIGRGSTNQRTPWCYGNSYTETITCEIETATGGANDCSVNSNNVPDGQWFHFALRWDGTTCQIYINGTASGTSDTTTGNTLADTDGETLRIGDLAGLGTWLGKIDEVKVYNRALSTQQIYQEYAAGLNNVSTNTLVSQELNSGEKWSTLVGACTATATSCTTELSNNITISDSIPILVNVTLSATSPSNLDSDNLTVTYNPIITALFNFTDWRRNGQSIAVLNMPFNVNISTTTADAVTDYSTHSNDGTLPAPTSMPTWINNGKIGGAYYFDGSDDYMSLGSFPSINGVGAVSVSAWVTKSDSGTFDTYRSIIDIGSSSILNCYSEVSTETLKCILYTNWVGSDCAVTSNNVPDGPWFHFAFNWNGSVCQIYINGTASGSSDTTTGTILSNTDSYNYIGRYYSYSTSWYGAIDEVKIYNRSLSPQQIYQEYLAGVNSQSTNILVSNETLPSEKWSTLVGVCDDTSCTTEVSNNVTISGGIIVRNVTLNATSTSNSTLDNLTVRYNSSNSSTYNFTDWRLNGQSIAVLNMPFNINVSTNIADAVTDYSTYSNDATLASVSPPLYPVWQSNGKVGGAYYFDSYAYMDLGSLTTLDGVSALTFSAWLNDSRIGVFAGYEGIIGIGSSNYRTPWCYGTNGAQTITCDVSTTTGGMNDCAAVSGNVPENQWFHLAFTWDGTTCQIYINGTASGTPDTSTGSVSQTSDNSRYIGYIQGYSNWLGKIDEVKIYNRALSPEQVYQEYSAGNTNKSVNVLVDEETSTGDNWTTLVGSCNQNECGTTLSNSIRITGATIDNIYLNATSPYNTTRDNLTLAYTVTGITYNLTDWRINGQSIAVLNMPFNVNVTSTAAGAVKDYSTYENNGKLGITTSTPRWDRYGKIGGTYYFDGGDFLNITSLTSLNGVSEMTFSMWLNKSDSSTFDTTRAVVSRGLTAQRTPWCYGNSATQTITCEFETTTGGAGDCTVTSNNVPDGQWFHFALTWDGSVCQIYINGTAGTPDTTTGTILATANGVAYLGYDSAGDYWIGKIDEVKIYDRALSTQQIYQEYAAGLNNQSVNIIVHNETKSGETWSALLGIFENNLFESTTSNSITIVSPAITNVNLSATSIYSISSDNLTATFNTQYYDNTLLNNFVDWRRNGQSIAKINMPFNVKATFIGDSVADYSTYGINGTLGGKTSATTPNWTSNGKVGGAYYFDGASTYINLSTLNINSTPQLTFTIWLNKSDSSTFDTTRAIFSRGNSAQRTPWCYANTGTSTITCELETPSGAADCSVTSGNVPDGQWFHFAFRWDGTTCQIYINGTASGASDTTTGTTLATSANEYGYLGYTTTYSSWLGMMDELKFYNKSLSQEQIYQEYLEGLPLQSLAVLNMPFTDNVSTTATGAVKDYSTWNNNGTLYDGNASDSNKVLPTWTNNGKVGGAYIFDSYDDCLSIPTTLSDELNPTTQITVMSWINMTSPKNNGFIVARGWGDSYDLASTSAGKILFRIISSSGSNSTYSSEVLSNNAWYHVAATYDSANIKIYINGVLSNSTPYAQSMQAYNQPVGIGCIPHMATAYFGNGFNGAIDEVKIYSMTLSPEQIYQEYLKGNNQSRFIMLNNETRTGETWSALAGTCNEDVCVTELSNNLTVLGATIETMKLNSTSIHNLTSDNLTLTYSAISANSIYNFTDWRLNGTSIAVLNMPFNFNVSTATGAVIDYSTFENNGTLGTPTIPRWVTSGKIGGAYYFDGSDDYISLGAFTTLDGANQTTVSVWLNKSDPSTFGSNRDIFSISNSNPTSCYGVNLAQTIRCMLTTVSGGYGDCTVTSANVPDGQLFHLAFTWNGSVCQIYINGAASGASDTTTGNTLANTDGNNYIGGASGDWQGLIDEVKIYNRSLSPEQIYQEYAAGLNNKSTNTLVGNETRHGDVWSTMIGLCDQTSCTTELSNNVTISQILFKDLALSATSANNFDADNLTAEYYSAGANTIARFTDWRKNGQSVAVLNMPFNIQVTSNATGAVKDYSTFGNNGTLGNGPVGTTPTWTSSGKVGGAYIFDGVNDYINVTDSPSLRPASLTLSGWVKFNNTPTGVKNILTKNYGTGTDESFSLFWYTGPFLGCSNALFGYISDGSGDASCVTFNPTIENWYFLATTFNNVTKISSLYIDGVLVANKTINKEIVYDSKPFMMGAEYESGVLSFFFNGSIDEVKLYNRSLSPEQIYQEYLDGLNGPLRARPSATIIMNQPFDNNITSTATGAVKEYSGYNNNGTLTNGPIWTSSGRLGGAYNFDGTDDYITTPKTGMLNNTGTIMLWLKPASRNSALKTAIDIADTGLYGAVIFSDSASDVWYFQYGNGSLVQVTGNALTVNNWHHIAVTYGSFGAKIYQNGVKINNNSKIADINLGALPTVRIGANVGSPRYFNGTIDEVKIYNNALSDEEVYQDYLAGLNSGQSTNVLVNNETASGDVWSTLVGVCDPYMCLTNVSNSVEITSPPFTLNSMIGTATDWVWGEVTGSAMIRAGSPTDWTWRQYSLASGYKTPNGTNGTNWNWVYE